MARVDLEVSDRLRQRLETAARTTGQPLDSFLTAALERSAATTCSTCGRTEAGEQMPAGLTQSFAAFVDEYKAGTNGPATVTTVEAGLRLSYWVRIRGDSPFEGMLMVYALLDQHGRMTLPIGIPRGVITGWRGDGDGTWHAMFLALGYVDGNARAREVARLMKRQGQY